MNHSYINIQGWMVSELKLTGNELIIFALIFGFSQDGESKFRGSYSYMEGWTGLNKQSLMNNINKLLEKGFISKELNDSGNLYYVNYEVISSMIFTHGGVKKSHRGGKEITPNNNNNNDNKELAIAHSLNNIVENGIDNELDDTNNGSQVQENSRIKEKQELTLEQVKTEYQNKKLMEYIFFLIRDTNFQDTVTLKQYQKYYDHILKAFFIVYGWDRDEAAKNRDYIFHTIDDMRKFYALRPNKPIKSFCGAINTWVQNSLKFNNQK